MTFTSWVRIERTDINMPDRDESRVSHPQFHLGFSSDFRLATLIITRRVTERPRCERLFKGDASKIFLRPQETLSNRPGSNLLTTRRFTRMAGRNSRYHHTLKRGLEQCSPTLKSATFSRSISSPRN